jgi:hypothetical protein
MSSKLLLIIANDESFLRLNRFFQLWVILVGRTHPRKGKKSGDKAPAGVYLEIHDLSRMHFFVKTTCGLNRAKKKAMLTNS